MQWRSADDVIEFEDESFGIMQETKQAIVKVFK
jgi:hypothetical protein